MEQQAKQAPTVPAAETVEQKIARLEAERDTALRAASSTADKTLRVKHSKDTGVVMVSGLGRFPTSLYPSQWVKVLAFAPSIAAYLRDHAVELEQIRLRREAEDRAK